jgi:hypothetical protein
MLSSNFYKMTCMSSLEKPFSREEIFNAIIGSYACGAPDLLASPFYFFRNFGPS